jgi:hypothetical protein
VTKKRRIRNQPAPNVDTALGVWSSFRALLAPTDKPMPLRDRDRILTRIERGYAGLQADAEPSLTAWRDMTDVVNFLQSLLELGWVTDEGQHIEGGKGALKQAADALEHHGKIRLTGQSIRDLREVLDRFTEILEALDERSYWAAVRHTAVRVLALQRGRKKPGDIVVSL